MKTYRPITTLMASVAGLALLHRYGKHSGATWATIPIANIFLARKMLTGIKQSSERVGNDLST